MSGNDLNLGLVRQIYALARKAGLKHERIANLLGVSESGLRNWLNEQLQQNPNKDRDELAAGLAEVIKAANEMLEKKGLLQSHLTDPTPERGGRAKRCYRVTKPALEALHASRRALTNLWEGLEKA